jgi:S-adenosylmethionine synthetase
MSENGGGEYLFTSESVTEGHPDKLCDQISDAVLDRGLENGDRKGARVACEVMVGKGFVAISGESRIEEELDLAEIARETIRKVGYDGFDERFSHDSVEILERMSQQSADIAMGVDAARESREQGSDDEHDLDGAGDQGMVFGFASDDTEALMPAPIYYSHRLAEQLAAVRKDGTLPYLRPDGKTQVTFRYRDGRPYEIERVLISTQHDPDVDRDSRIRPDLLEHVIGPILSDDLFDRDRIAETLLINPTGRFVEGGPVADAGLTGRKIVVDTYGGMGRHGGGAFSGKDPSKVDRSGAYAARHVAKNVVAAKLARKCEVQIAYAIGVATPVSVMVESFGTGALSDEKLTEIVNEQFDLRPGALREYLDLHRPIFSETAAYGHFGRVGNGFTWERTDRVNDLRRAAGLEGGGGDAG